ncbi:MAG: hypothetical protein AAFY41_08165, partial [Bacteroidota bacterium]
NSSLNFLEVLMLKDEFGLSSEDFAGDDDDLKYYNNLDIKCKQLVYAFKHDFDGSIDVLNAFKLLDHFKWDFIAAALDTRVTLGELSEPERKYLDKLINEKIKNLEMPELSVKEKMQRVVELFRISKTFEDKFFSIDLDRAINKGTNLIYDLE